MQGEKIAEFRAIIPQIKSAILIGVDESQVKLDVPASDKAGVLDLAEKGFGKVLRVTITEDDG